jgi:hypothetical protein
MWKILLVSVVLIGLAFAGIAIKMLLQKGGQFKKSCSSVHPVNGEKLGCICDGQDPQNCENLKIHHPDQVKS